VSIEPVLVRVPRTCTWHRAILFCAFRGARIRSYFLRRSLRPVSPRCEICSETWPFRKRLQVRTSARRNYKVPANARPARQPARLLRCPYSRRHAPDTFGGLPPRYAPFGRRLATLG